MYYYYSRKQCSKSQLLSPIIALIIFLSRSGLLKLIHSFWFQSSKSTILNLLLSFIELFLSGFKRTPLKLKSFCFLGNKKKDWMIIILRFWIFLKVGFFFVVDVYNSHNIKKRERERARELKWWLIKKSSDLKLSFAFLLPKLLLLLTDTRQFCNSESK